MIPSKYLKAADLKDEPELDLTIEGCVQETMPTDNKKKWVLEFREEDKGLILNVTNLRTLGDLFGDISEHWTGRRVRLYVASASYQGRQVPGIRLKAAGTADTQLSLEDIPA